MRMCKNHKTVPVYGPTSSYCKKCNAAYHREYMNRPGVREKLATRFKAKYYSKKKEQYSYKEAREIMVAYLLYKLSVNDIHAVADAAMDIREMDAKHQPQ